MKAGLKQLPAWLEVSLHLRRIPHPQLDPHLLQQPLEPRIVPARLHPHPHLLPRQRPVKLLRFRTVLQPLFLYFACSVVKDRDLLKPRMKITAYNQQDGSSHEPWSCSSLTNLLKMGQRRYAIKRSESSPIVTTAASANVSLFAIRIVSNRCLRSSIERPSIPFGRR